MDFRRNMVLNHVVMARKPRKKDIVSFKGTKNEIERQRPRQIDTNQNPANLRET